jgi:thermitase
VDQRSLRRRRSTLILVLVLLLVAGPSADRPLLAAPAPVDDSAQSRIRGDDEFEGEGDDDYGGDDDDDIVVAPPPAPTGPPPAGRRSGGPIVDEDGDPTTDGYRAAQAILKLRDGASIDAVNGRIGTATMAALPDRGLYLVEILGDEPAAESISRIEGDADVEWVELNHVSQAPEGRPGYIFVTGAPDAGDEPGYAEDLLGLPAAHACASGGGIVVAVLDTGVDAAHPSLTGRVLSRGYNALAGSSVTSDAGDGLDDDGDGLTDEMTGHGTHVAGIVLQVAPAATILPVRVLDSDGVGDAFFLAEGIYYAIEAGARVINLSLSSTVDARVVREAVVAATDAGVTVVAAAGNGGRDRPVELPAGHTGVLGVAATDAGDRKSDFSNYGPHVGLAAPGTGIASTLPGGGFGHWSGTSMATPFVAGAVALLLGQDDGLTLDDVHDRLISTSAELDELNPTYAGLLGAGRLDVAAAAGCPD